MTLANINASKLQSVQVPIAPSNAQTRIVQEIEMQFTRIDAALAALKRVKSNVKRYRSSVLRAACTGHLNRVGLDHAATDVASISSSLPRLPSHWQWSTFEEVAERITVGHVGPMKTEYVVEGIPFLRSQNVRPNRFESTGLKFISPAFHAKLKKSKLRPGDVVIVRSGDVGTACVIPDELEDANCADLVIVQRPYAVQPKFAAYYLNSVAQSLIEAGKVGVALTHFNTKSVAALPVPVPPFEEQRMIIEEVERRLSVIEELEGSVDGQLRHAAGLKQVILFHAFAGRLIGSNDLESATPREAGD